MAKNHSEVLFGFIYVRIIKIVNKNYKENTIYSTFIF